MELRHLRYFVKVASELHFGRAADQLGISQPPLSQQIRMLEEELGVPLFERTSRRVRLTVAGRLFLDEANATLAQAAHAMQIARRAALGEVGELSIGLSASSLYVPTVSDAIGDFRRAYPDVHLDLTERGFTTQRDGVEAGTLDFGLIRSQRRPAVPNGVALFPIVHDRMYVAFSSGHDLAAQNGPIALADIAGEEMIHYPYDPEGFQDDLRRLFESVGAHFRVVQEAREMSTLLGLVAAGVGITVLPGPLRRLQVDTVRYRELSDASASSTMWLIHSAEDLRPTCRAFLDIIAARLAAVGVLDLG